MNSYRCTVPSAFRLALLALATILFAASCEPPIKKPTGPARDYLDAKDLFKKGNMDRTLEFTEGIAEASPPNDYTQRAQVMRIIIFSGRIKAYTELAEAYGKGADKTKNATFKASYERLRNDALLSGGKAALGLGQTAHGMAQGAGIAKEVVLEVPYPDAEGPVAVPQLNRVVEGGWIEAGDQEQAALEAQRKGIDDALAEAVQGDRAKARTELTAGPVKIDGIDFTLFLGRQLLAGAVVFDRKHYKDYQKFKLMTGEVEEVANQADKMLKDAPDKDKEKELKKLQDDLKAAIKKYS